MHVFVGRIARHSMRSVREHLPSQRFTLEVACEVSNHRKRPFWRWVADGWKRHLWVWLAIHRAGNDRQMAVVGLRVSGGAGEDGAQLGNSK